MRKIRNRDILVDPNKQVPKARKFDANIAFVIINKAHNDQKEILAKKDLSDMDWQKQITI